MTLTHEDLSALKATFAANEHEFLQGNAYIQEQPITDRIESIDPAWAFEIRAINVRANAGEGGKDVFTVAVHAALTIKGVTRENVGMATIQKSNPVKEMVWDDAQREKVETGNTYTSEANEGEKAATTDALKRCARLFGIGRYLLTLSDDVKDIASMERWLKQNSKPQAVPPVPTNTSGQQTDSGKSGEKWTDDVQQMEWLKNTVALMRDVYGDTHVDTAKVTVKATDFQTAMEYADALEVQAEVAKADWFKAAIMLASKFLYTEGTEYNAFKHNASIDKRLQDKGDLGINPSQTLLEALNRLIRYRALADLYLDSTDYPKIFGIPFEDYVDKHGHLATWQRMNQYFAAQLEPAKTKIAS